MRVWSWECEQKYEKEWKKKLLKSVQKESKENQSLGTSEEKSLKRVKKKIIELKKKKKKLKTPERRKKSTFIWKWGVKIKERESLS